MPGCCATSVDSDGEKPCESCSILAGDSEILDVVAQGGGGGIIPSLTLASSTMLKDRVIKKSHDK